MTAAVPADEVAVRAGCDVYYDETMGHCTFPKCDCSDARDSFPSAVKAALTALRTHDAAHGGWRPPEGYVLVPKEPTLDMLRAYCGALENPAAAQKEMWHHTKARKRYRAMIAAAPPSPKSGG